MSVPKFLADEDFRLDIVLAIRRRDQSVDIVTVQEAGLQGTPDAELLAIAADAGRIVVSHDCNTMIATAHSRITSGGPMAGLLVAPQVVERARVAETLVLITRHSSADEWMGVIDYLPW